MNTPNKLTLLRMMLVPVFMVFLLVKSIPFHYLTALVVFAAAAITDALDGYLARKNNQVTTFGKFLDPVADKVLVLSAFICFIPLNYANAAAVVIIIAREFMVTSVRLVAASSDGEVIAAGMSGKIKTAFSMAAIVAILLLCACGEFVVYPFEISLIANILVWISAALTVISGVEYLVVNRRFINTTK